MSKTNRQPDEIHNVSHGMLSVARHFGECKFNGEHYTYFALQDILVRSSLGKNMRAAAKREKQMSNGTVKHG